MIQDKTTAKPITGVITIHDITTAEFITGVINGQFNENDVHHYCEKQPYLMALSKSLLSAASTLIQSKGIEGGFAWNLTERRFDFDNPKDMRLYCDVEFVRLQNAMGIVCDLIEEQPVKIQPEIMTERAKKYFAKAIEAGFMEQRGNGYKWTFRNGQRGAKAALAHFLESVYSPDKSSPQIIPFKALERLFGVNRLDSTLYALNGGGQRQKWRGEIDGLFDD